MPEASGPAVHGASFHSPDCHAFVPQRDILVSRYPPGPGCETARASAVPRCPTTGQCLGVLFIGLLPLAGLIACILLGYSPAKPAAVRHLAKAILWVHGAALLLLNGVLCLWVLSLAGLLPL